MNYQIDYDHTKKTSVLEGLGKCGFKIIRHIEDIDLIIGSISRDKWKDLKAVGGVTGVYSNTAEAFNGES